MTKGSAPSASPRVSLVIVTRDEDPEIVARTLQGIRDTTQGWCETIVIDDGSAVPVVLGSSDIVLRRTDAPLGPAGARRLGASLATGDVFVWLDAHMSFGAGWLEAMCAGVATGALCCSPWRNYDRDRVHAYGADFAWIERRDHAAGIRPGFDFALRRARPRRRLAQVPQIVGACYAMQRSAYDTMGGCCPLFEGYGADEADMSIRAWLSGVGVVCARDAEVGHLDRVRIPYPASFDDVEFNHAVAIRAAFSPPVISLLEEYLHPLSDEVMSRLHTAPVGEWRTRVQSARHMTDSEFFRRIAPLVPIRMGEMVRPRYGHLPATRRSAALTEEAQRTARRCGVEHAPADPRAGARHGSPIPDRCLLHVGVVCWNASAIVLAGPLEGRRALIDALVSEGATYVTTHTALLHGGGTISAGPFSAANEAPLPVSAVVGVETVATTGTPRITRATPAEAALLLLDSAPGSRDALIFTAVNAAAAHSAALLVTRGEVRRTARALLALLPGA